MPRRRKSRGLRRSSSTYLPRQTSLAEPFPQAFYREAQYQIMVSRDNDSPCVFLFYATYAAHAFISFIYNLGKVKWNGYEEFHVDPLTVRGKALDEIVEYEPTNKEAEWSLPPQYKRSVYALLMNTASVQREPKPKKAPGEYYKEARKGLVTAIELANDYEITPRELRGILRKAGLKKPAVGWAWPDDEVPNIRKIIMKGLKK